MKILAKLLLARLNKNFIKRLIGIFRHGNMQDLSYVDSIIKKHFNGVEKDAKLNVLELGPGESLSSGIILAQNYPNIKIDFLDVSDFATASTPLYSDFLNKKNIKIRTNPTETFLAYIQSKYYTDGLSSIKHLPSNSYDIIFSQAVLEHIFLDEFDEFILNAFRILKSTGKFSAQIDFRDHLGGQHTNLAFSNAIWESYLFKNSGFYTNRISPSDMMKRFEQVGFKEIIISDVKYYEKMSNFSKFGNSDWTENDLLIESLFLSCKK